MSDLKGKIVTGRKPRAVDEFPESFEPGLSKSQLGSIPVSFTVNKNNPAQYEEVQFNDTTPDAVEWNWNFGDGFTSQEQNPSHVYGGVSGSQYTVTLVVKNSSGLVGIEIKEGMISISSSRYINEALTGTQLILSLKNKVDPGQTKWANIRDSSDNNVYTIGYNNDQPDTNDISNKVSGDAFIESIYKPDDSILCTESTTSAQWKYNLANLYGQFQSKQDRAEGFYDFVNNITIDRVSLYVAVLVNKQSGGSDFAELFDEDPNNRGNNLINISSIITDDLGLNVLNVCFDAGVYLLEIFGSNNKTFAVSNGEKSQIRKDGLISLQFTLLDLFARINETSFEHYEYLISSSPYNDRQKYIKYINNKYGLNIPR